MVYESGYKPGSENPRFTSDLSLSNSLVKLKKKPCEVCGSDANEHLMMTCFMCRDAREHTYCARVMLQRVPRLWICEECRDFSSIANKTANSQAAQPSRTIQVEQVVVKEVCIDQTVPSSTTIVDNETLIEAAAPSSRTNQVVDNKDWIEAAAPSLRSNHVVEQVVPVAPRTHHEYTTDESTPESSSPVSPCSLRDETNLFHFNYPSLSLPPLMKN
ncbi:unnamed protein product [Arabidopsis halleri]